MPRKKQDSITMAETPQGVVDRIVRNSTPQEKVEQWQRAIARAHGSIEHAAEMKDKLPELRSNLAAAQEEVAAEQRAAAEHDLVALKGELQELTAAMDKAWTADGERRVLQILNIARTSQGGQSYEAGQSY
jgi:hypothetical protein